MIVLTTLNWPASLFTKNKPKRLTSRDKIEPVDLCQLLISVDCWFQSIVDLSWLSISVNCQSQLIVNLSWISISVNCWSQSIVDLSWLLISVDCWSQSIVNLSQLSISVNCRSQSFVGLSCLYDIRWNDWFKYDFEFWWQTDWLTNELTMLVVKLQPRLRDWKFKT